jgi:hypothetical protein
MRSEIFNCLLQPIFEDTIQVTLDYKVIGDPALLGEVLCLAFKLNTHYNLLQIACEECFARKWE